MAENLAVDEIVSVVFKLLDIDRDGIIKKDDLSDFAKIEFRDLSETRFGAELSAEMKLYRDLDLEALTAVIKTQ